MLLRPDHILQWQFLRNLVLEDVPTKLPRRQASSLSAILNDPRWGCPACPEAFICEDCDGAGVLDSGGSTAWGEWISVPCSWCDGRGVVELPRRSRNLRELPQVASSEISAPWSEDIPRDD